LRPRQWFWWHQVNFDGQVAIERAGRIANYCAQMDHGVHALHAFDQLIDATKVSLHNFQVGMIDNVVNRLESVEQPIKHTNAMARASSFGTSAEPM